MAQVEHFNSTETCKRGLVICESANEFNYMFIDYGSGYLPGDCTGSWTEKYDLEEDGDFSEDLQYTRFLFEAITPLQVRREALLKLKNYKGGTELTINQQLGF